MDRDDVERGVLAFLATMRRAARKRGLDAEAKVPVFANMSLSDRALMMTAITNAIVTAQSKPPVQDQEIKHG